MDVLCGGCTIWWSFVLFKKNAQMLQLCPTTYTRGPSIADEWIYYSVSESKTRQRCIYIYIYDIYIYIQGASLADRWILFIVLSHYVTHVDAQKYVDTLGGE